MKGYGGSGELVVGMADGGARGPQILRDMRMWGGKPVVLQDEGNAGLDVAGWGDIRARE